jgi:hypothetical protein
MYYLVKASVTNIFYKIDSMPAIGGHFCLITFVVNFVSVPKNRTV